MRNLIFILVWCLSSQPALALDVNGELKRAQLEKLSADPTSSEARLYYNTVSKKAKVYNGTAWGELGGSGSGEKNYVTSPSSATGWSTVTATATTTTTGTALPRENTTASGISIAGGTTTSHYVAWCFTIDDADKSKKLKAQWDQKPASYATGDFRVEIYSFATASCGGAATELALSTDASTHSSIPNFEGRYTTTFDTTTADYYGVRFVRVAGSSTLVVSDVVVGPGIQPHGAIVTEWTAFSPTIGGCATDGTVSLNASYTKGYWRRVGDSFEAHVSYVFSTVTTAPTGNLTIKLPNSLLRNTDVAPIVYPGSDAAIGGGSFYDGGAGVGWLGIGIQNGHGCGTDEVAVTPTQPTSIPTIASGDEMKAHFTVPIAAWAGTGTVSLLQDETLTEWKTYTPTITGGATLSVNTGYWRRVGDSMQIRWKGHFGSAGAAAAVSFSLPSGYTIDTAKMGALNQVSAYAGDATYYNGTGATVDIQAYVAYTTSIYFISPGTAATDLAGTTLASGHQIGFVGMVPIVEWSGKSNGAIGFGEHVPGKAGGLVGASGVKGATAGATVAAGYVGQKLPFTSRAVTVTTAGSWFTNATALATLTAGVWMVFSEASMPAATTTADANYVLVSTGLSAGSGSIFNNGGGVGLVSPSTTSVSNNSIMTLPPSYMNVSADTPLYAHAYAEDRSGTITTVTGYAVRIQ